MKLAIDGGGYATATDAFVTGNQVAALCHDALTGKLAGYGGMAGDDSTSVDFAASYDEAAALALDALADLVTAFANLGTLTHATLGNHGRAEARSVIRGTQVYDGGVLPAAECVEVLPSRPASSLGSNAIDLPSQMTWILDHIEGFVWPGADTDRLRDAAQTWRTAADSLGDLSTYCDSAVRGLSGERSPEIPLAIAAVRDLQSQVREVTDQYAALASACETCADHVEAKRREVIELAQWLLEQVVEGVLISVAIGVLTGGAGAAAGMAAVVARVAAESPRFLAIVNALRALTAGTAAGLRLTRGAISTSRLRLAKFTHLRLTLRSEAGEARFPGWLLRHEHSGSHTLGKHVGMTDDNQTEVLSSDPPAMRPPSSTSRRPRRPSRLCPVDRAHLRVAEWNAGPSQAGGCCCQIIGRSMDAAGTTTPVQGIRVILVRDQSMTDGYRILTGFPQP